MTEGKGRYKNGQGGPPQTTFQRLLQNQVQIDFDNENDDFCDEINNNFDDYGDENDQIHGFLVKIYSFQALLLGKKKDQNKRAGVDLVSYPSR